MRLAVLLALLFVLVIGIHAQYYGKGSRAKRRCYQCNMPFQCDSGSCYGDVCVKSLVVSANGRYVSKGCENNTETYRSKSSHSSVWDPKKDSSYCRTELVFGVENVICYCSDDDFCNSSPRNYGVVTLFSILFSLLLLR